MSQHVYLEPVFVLHHRPYQNSSLIVEFLTQQYGRITVVARSARGPKSRFKGYLQPFSPLLASWSGLRELKSLNHLELSGSPASLNGQALLCAFYLNELLLRLLPKEDPYPEIFADYRATLQGLVHIEQVPVILRKFEKRLLENLGYGLSFQVNSDEYYRWRPEQGFLRCENSADNREPVFLGRSLLALKTETWNNTEDLLAAKKLMRLVLGQYLGAKPLKSRELLA